MSHRLLAALALALATPTAPPAAERPTFSVDYVVRVRRGDPQRAHVTWRLAGIDEIRGFRLVFRDARTTDVRGTGQLHWRGRTLLWTPGRPYAHLRYAVEIDRRRPPGGRLDSHASAEWVATRALHLCPEINVVVDPGAGAAHARTRLVFQLPSGWRAAAAGERRGPRTYRLEEPGKRFDRPRGWFLLGRIERRRRTIAGMTVTVAVAPGSALDARRVLRLYTRTAPLLAGVLGPPPPRLLVVSAPDPMWHGGLSGEESFFVNGRIPLVSRDGTSTYLHELFHVWQPFRTGPDAQWIAEGLAEYYTLVLRARSGQLSARGFARGLRLFARYGRWHSDLSRTHEPAALNNSAPLVMDALDARIGAASGGRGSLDDVVRALAREGGVVTTARFLRAANRAAGRDLTAFFRRHVFRGEPPAVPPRTQRLARLEPLR